LSTLLRFAAADLRDKQEMMCFVAMIWVQSVAAQEPQCRLYKVQSNSLNISKEPRGDAAYIDILDSFA
jgi:hypothetical protein